MPGESRCRSCLAPIKWAKTEAGKNIPLDPDPTPDGNVLLVNGVATVFAGDELAEQRAKNTVLHISHFATCRYASSHRRNR